jgi:glutamine amidotransferase
MQHIAVIDYHMGNLRSVSKALEHVAGRDARISITHDAATISAADKVVFPGQGAARDCMREIHAHHLADPIREVIADRPFLGICMGLQVLLEESEESPGTPCLSLLPGRVHRLPGTDEAGRRLTIPQMGWNQVFRRCDHPLWAGIEDGERFYFCNSYYADPADAGVVNATTRYGVTFACAVAREQLFAVQFHPEKSQHAGLALLGNFVRW